MIEISPRHESPSWVEFGLLGRDIGTNVQDHCMSYAQLRRTYVISPSVLLPYGKNYREGLKKKELKITTRCHCKVATSHIQPSHHSPPVPKRPTTQAHLACHSLPHLPRPMSTRRQFQQPTFSTKGFYLLPSRAPPRFA